MVLGILIMFPGSYIAIIIATVVGVIFREYISWIPPVWSIGIIVSTILLGGALLVYGAYLWEKYRHIMWTKQSLREYESEKLRIAEFSGKKTIEPLKSEILNEKQIERQINLLNEKLIHGEIDEETYKKLISKYKKMK